MLFYIILFLYSNADPIRILPLGDSITFGCGDACAFNCAKTGIPYCSKCAGGWRAPLWRSLNSTLPHRFQFVGSKQNGPNDINPYHEGHPGWTIKMVQNIFHTKWGLTKPDLILLHIGTNNLGTLGLYQSANETILALNDFISFTFEQMPTVHIFLASIIGSGLQYGGRKHTAYNAEIPNIVQKYKSMGFNITFVDMANESGIGPRCENGCCPMRIHPTDSGYKKMSDVWFAHIRKLYSSLQ